MHKQVDTCVSILRVLCALCDAVPMDMDVRMKTVLLGAVFLIVSSCFMRKILSYLHFSSARQNGQTDSVFFKIVYLVVLFYVIALR